MLRAIICDHDEKILVTMTRIVTDLLANCSACSKIHSYTNVNEIGAPILASCDIALLSIDSGNGKDEVLEIAQELRCHRPDAIIILISDSIEYALEGYEVRAFRFILKKDVQQKLPQYLKLALEVLATSGEMLKIKICGEIIDLRLREIAYIESRLRMVDVHMKRNKWNETEKVYSYYATMCDLEKRLEPLGFLRIHKSYIVNMQLIRCFRNREVLLCDGTPLRVGTKDYAVKKSKYLMWKGLV